MFGLLLVSDRDVIFFSLFQFFYCMFLLSSFIYLSICLFIYLLSIYLSIFARGSGVCCIWCHSSVIVTLIHFPYTDDKKTPICSDDKKIHFPPHDMIFYNLFSDFMLVISSHSQPSVVTCNRVPPQKCIYILIQPSEISGYFHHRALSYKCIVH